MEEINIYNQEETIIFLPERLNKPPVVFRGLTNDELIGTFIVGVILGFLIGVVAYLVIGNGFLIPLMIIVVTALAIILTSLVLRKAKRNKPDTWFYRQVQFTCQVNGLKIGQALILRSGCWSVRRAEAFRQKLLKEQKEQIKQNESI